MAIDPNLSFWLAVAGSIIVGVVVGILFQRRTGSAAHAAKLEADLAQARSDLMRYREETARHFGKSADLLGRMAGDYREFLDHFVGGAAELCGDTLKEIHVTTLERPLLDASSETAPVPADATTSTDAEPFTADAPK